MPELGTGDTRAVMVPLVLTQCPHCPMVAVPSANGGRQRSLLSLSRMKGCHNFHLQRTIDLNLGLMSPRPSGTPGMARRDP